MLFQKKELEHDTIEEEEMLVNLKKLKKLCWHEEEIQFVSDLKSHLVKHGFNQWVSSKKSLI